MLLGLSFTGLASGAETAWIDDGRYPDSAAAARAWTPMGGTAPAAVATLEGRQVLRLTCNFAGTRIERASWDRTVQLDLGSCRGLQFEFRCPNPAPVSHFSLYLQSGNGWYHATFFPEATNAWNTIRLDKTAFGIEGTPAGWGQIRTLRLSAWRGRDTNTELFLRDLRRAGALGSDALVAIVRGDSAAQRSPAEARSVNQFAEQTAQMLQALEVGYTVVSDLDLSAARVQPAKAVILPHNPSLPDVAAQALLDYLGAGGKLLVFYAVPEQLRSVIRVQSEPHLTEPRPGYFAAIRCLTNALAGAPALVSQRSWNINAVQALPGASLQLAEWLDERGQPTGHAAILGSTNWLLMTHVLLTDDPDNKRRLLLALLGRLAPEVWEQAAQTALQRTGVIAAGRTFAEVVTAISALTNNNPRAAEALAAASAARDAATQLAAHRQFIPALDQAAVAGRRVQEAWCRVQPSLPGEFRAFWCHSAFGVPGMDWDEAARRLAENGFTAILPNMLWGGMAYYASRVLPVSPEVAGRGDQIARCVAAARKYGLQVHVWKVNWNLAHNAPKELVTRLRDEGRLQANARGQQENWLCPSHPRNQQLEIESMLEVARRYDVDGLHFDYIRYPDSDHCYCAGCRERFQRAAQVTLPDWPKPVLGEGPLRRTWLDWRRSHITAVVKAVSEQAHTLKPKIKISAAVFRNWPQDRDSIGQDWKLWCDRGWLDFVCPMDYTTSPRQFDNLVAQQLEWTGRVPCYPGIGESASSSRLGVDEVIAQILVTRRHRTGGFVIFNYGLPEAKELLPMLGLGITARP
jgi:uncharacterized lipoprotein YddW (UPF0748 family)